MARVELVFGAQPCDLSDFSPSHICVEPILAGAGCQQPGCSDRSNVAGYCQLQPLQIRNGSRKGADASGLISTSSSEDGASWLPQLVRGGGDARSFASTLSLHSVWETHSETSLMVAGAPRPPGFLKLHSLAVQIPRAPLGGAPGTLTPPWGSLGFLPWSPCPGAQGCLWLCESGTHEPAPPASF